MNTFKSTSQQPQNRDTKIHPLVRGKTIFLATGLIALSWLGFSPAWAGEYHSAKPASIHLTGLSINISPGGFHIGVGGPYYGRSYGPYLHIRPWPRPYWKHSRHHHRRHHHYAKPHRFKHRHGWKGDRSRGQYRGKDGRRNERHRGGRW